MRNTVIFYKDWHEAIKEFSPDERLKAYDAIMQYAFDDVIPVDKFIRVATALMRSTIDRDNNKYEEKCERNRRNIMNRWRKRIEAEDSKTTDATPVNEPIRPNTTATDNSNDNENDNGNENDNEPTTKVVGDTKKKEKKSIEKKKVADAPTRFQKPKVEEVAAYCKERGNYVDAQHFVDFYESKGWKVGNSPMKDWKAAVRTWEQRDGRARKPAPKGVTLGVGEWIDEQGVRRYGSGKYTAPLNAPARPSESSFWSAETNSWITGV